MFVSEGDNTLPFCIAIIDHLLVCVDPFFLYSVGVCQCLEMCYLLQLKLLTLYVPHGNNSLYLHVYFSIYGVMKLGSVAVN